MLKWAMLLMIAAAEPAGEQVSVRSGYARLRGAVQAVTYSVSPDGMCFVGGDIAIGTVDEIAALTQSMRSADQRQAAVGRTGEEWRWPDGRIPYVVSPDLPASDRVRVAVDALNKQTVLRWVPRTDEVNYVEWVARGGCWSYVGMRGGRQEISLSSGCSAGNAKHEGLHAAGMWHEQSREDRDRYVIIHWDNIYAGRASNFAKHDKDGDDLGPYDPGSIMHYGPTAFAKQRGLITIETIDPDVTIGQRIRISTGDALGIEILYGAEPEKREYTIVTVFGSLEAKVAEPGKPALWTKDLPRGWRVQWQPSYLAPIPEAAPAITWTVRAIPRGKRYTRWIITVKKSNPGEVRIKPLSTITKRKRVGE